MKVAIDISILTQSGQAYGNANGTLDFDVAPEVGDTISFAAPKVAGLPRVVSFTGMLRVTDRVLNAAGGSKPSIAIEDIVVPSVEEARAVAQYLEAGFGLGVDVY